MNRYTRRELLGIGGGSLAVGGVAGCLGRSTGGSEGMTVHASFFTLYDFTRNVAADHLTVRNPVPAEQHGHGWEPSTNLLPEIVEGDAFVYLDASGFQPWAESVADEIEDSYDDVLLIDALDGIDLVEYESDHHDTHDNDHNHNSSEDSQSEPTDDYGPVDKLELVDSRSRQILAQYHFGHWHGELPALAPGNARWIEPRFVDSQNTTIPVDADRYHIAITSDDDETLTVAVDDADFTVEGHAVGEAELSVELHDAEGVVFSAEPLVVAVDDESAEGPEPDHGLVDVKFFSDPVLAQRSVRTIRDGLVELDPANEAAYREGAETYIQQLDDLHRLFQTELAGRDRETVVLAGHDSLNYLGRQYGFEIETPVGLSPNDEPSSRDIAAAVDIVEDHEITHVLWDYFDGDRSAEAIVAEADSATQTAMVSAAESSLESWKDEGYGDYIGQMREINLPAFKAALGAD